MIKLTLETLATVGRLIYGYKLTYKCCRDLYRMYNGTLFTDDGRGGHDL